MIRDAVPQDVPLILDLAVEAELFTIEEVGMVEELLVGSADEKGHGCAVDVDGDQLLGVVYFQPIGAADAVWDLTMLAVHPSRQRSGVGAALMARAEGAVRAAGGRLLTVQTSGAAAYAAARGFYAAVGYDEEARVRDYWTDGDDLVLFRKDLRHG